MNYEVKVKYLQIEESGKERKKTNTYILDAVSFSDAEARIFEAMNTMSINEFEVMNIKKSNITEIEDRGNEWLFKAKISLVTIDEDAGKEKKINQHILVSGDDIDQASENLADSLTVMLAPYTIVSIALSTICEQLHFDK